MSCFADADSFQSFVDAVWQRMSAKYGFVSESECPGVTWGRQQGDIRFDEGMQRMASPSCGCDPYWIVLCRMQMSDVIPAEYMTMLLKTLPSAAACFLYLKEPSLSAAEDDLLYSRFAEADGKMTTMLAALNSGAVVRAKA